MNGSGAIHDYEVTRFGSTSEDVAAGLRDGTFGMAEETGRGMNEAFTRGRAEGLGMGESLAMALGREPKLAHPELSVVMAAQRLGVPVTVHAALGAEIIHQHPAADGAAIGDTSHRDFRRLAASIERLDDGGVALNIGSAVIMPEVFLKALTVARNLGQGKPQNFVTCDMDMQRHYRPHVNVVKRPTQDSGKGYEITGHHELMVPLLAWAVVERLNAGLPTEAQRGRSDGAAPFSSSEACRYEPEESENESVMRFAVDGLSSRITKYTHAPTIRILSASPSSQSIRTTNPPKSPNANFRRKTPTIAIRPTEKRVRSIVESLVGANESYAQPSNRVSGGSREDGVTSKKVRSGRFRSTRLLRARGCAFTLDLGVREGGNLSNRLTYLYRLLHMAGQLGRS
jgi:hypothetical protein